ncbi:hypothetical protein KC19_VG207800 [Ceratodon purpureus]|uniref:Uncharacterized protein n=1 Tax=Ceratodon purpureus TaxID=3225 RepID=A0A8T0HS73_CERPU|nr:hypothetical protein KC19_VG207800 [Ceratodon purpureus]
MSLEAFDYLVHMFTPYLKSQCINLVRPKLEIRKIVAQVLHGFAHGYSLDHIANRLKAAGSTITKYVDIVSDILSNKDKLLSRCISEPRGVRLQGIIDDFREITCVVRLMELLPKQLLQLQLWTAPAAGTGSHSVFRGRPQKV